MRRRGAGQKWKRPSTTLGSRPPGLVGREIGLYYRNKQMKKQPKSIRLEVPDTVISAIHANIRSIEDIARKENIYLTPVKRLKFNKPKAVSDVLPLKAEGTVNNLVPNDDDVIVILPDEVSDVKNGSYVLPVKVEGTVNNLVPNDDDVIVILPDEVSDVKNISDVLPLKVEGTVNNLVPNDDDVIFVSPDEVSDMKNDPVNPKNKPFCVKNDETNEVLVLSDQSSDGDIEIKDVPMNISDSTADDKNAMKIEKKDELQIENYVNPHNVNLLDADEGTKAFVPDTKAPNEPVVASGSSTNEMIIHDDNEAGITRDNINEAKQLEYTVSNIYIPSTSTINQQSITGANNYKYGYEDIITGTFEEKLNESISKGISINIRNGTTNELNKALLDEYNIMVEERKYKQMKKFRETLPTFKKTKDLLDIVNDNQVVVISGETGCGKSTQVPQIILDDAIKNNRGANVKILVTQPRRIAASSLAMRVADERAETMGKSVGYAVRLERVDCRERASIMFCTTGVLLVELEVDQCLSKYSHIILDEVHERDCQIDISMCVLKQVLKKRKDLKLILMSATIDAETLCAYYDDCPMLHIEGLAYPVQDIYLEEILSMTRYELPPPNAPCDNGKPWMKHMRRRKFIAVRNTEKDIQYKAEIGPWLESIKDSIDVKTYKTLQDSRIELINTDLIMQLLLKVCGHAPGAILVFLPGISDINQLMNKMRDSRMFPEYLYDIHPLHSKLPTITQHKIFVKPPGNIRKIIIATNIAETSITIDDVVYVIDCAKIKYSGLNVEDYVSTLQVEWASQANLRQRRGRAGRCQPGICYHLLTSFRASKLPERLLPELQRNDLLEPVLQIKRLRLGLADQALKIMPAVPDEKTIMNAVRHLQQCGALDGKETLTPLGWHLARLPVHPAAGKLLLLGSLFGCLERAASVAAVWGFKDPFLLVPDRQEEADQAKRSLALGEPSDHIAISEALMHWERCWPYSQKILFANDYFLSTNTLNLLSDMKQQFGQNLKHMGFLRSGDVKSMWENRNTDNLALFKAIVAASLYPNIATVKWGNLYTRNPNKIPYIKIKTPEDPRVQVHPSSIMYTKHTSLKNRRKTPLCSEPGANWLVYWLKQRSTDLYLIDVTLVYTLPLLFFGELNVTQAENPDECQIDIKSIKVLCAKDTTQLLFRLRSLLDQVLASKIMISGGGKRSSVFEEHVLNAVIRLITAEDARTDYFDDDQSGSDDYDRDERRWY